MGPHTSTASTRAAAIRVLSLFTTVLALAAIVAAQPTTTFPTPKGTVVVTETRLVSGSYDGQLQRFTPQGLGDGSSSETQKPVFLLEPGSSLSDVIIGAPGADGIHCKGNCTLRNVWWEDVGEDAATLLSSAPKNSVFRIIGGGARNANDKTFQNNANMGKMVIRDFYVSGVGKLYRSCGSGCSVNAQRFVVVKDVIAEGVQVSLVAINVNNKDTAKLRRITIRGDPSKQTKICEWYNGGTKLGNGPGNGCDYSASDVRYV